MRSLTKEHTTPSIDHVYFIAGLIISQRRGIGFWGDLMMIVLPTGLYERSKGSELLWEWAVARQESGLTIQWAESIIETERMDLPRCWIMG